ncbi:MAG TPA: HAMP domain-containing sensor histidine kinase [Ilumatobacteraceae bacterium]|nr:HAMP domain-containing sensor histidine kinase [Ilumatobacteraceae bacterium]
MAAESGRRRFGTIRVRVTALATVAVGVVLVVASVLLVARQRAGLVDQLDETLSTEAESLADVLESGGRVPTLDDDDRIVIVTGANGEVVSTSGDIDEIDSPLPIADDEGRDISFDDETYRLVSASYDLPDGGQGAVHMAGARDDVDESVAELTASLVWIVPLAVLALLAVVWVVVGRTLRPVERIRAQVAGIGVAELDRRVPEPTGDDEIARLAVTMNEMLERLERSVRRQQRFVADASHELRTPLTRMRTELEVDERDPACADAGATRRSQLEEIAGLQRMIEDLLHLARSDAGTAGRRSELVDLDDIVLEEIRALGRPDRVIDASRVSAAQVMGDPDELRRVVRNLVDNAGRHATTTVDIELTETGTQATLVVADDGPGIPPERRTDVFERFARVDESRTGGAGRAGLGLAIVHDIVTRHNGTITIDDGPSGGARFEITLPTR